MKYAGSIILLFFSYLSLAQYQAAPVWFFGEEAGLDFRSGNVNAVKSPLNTHSALSATQCDADGNILFSANGINIWDRNGNPIPGGSNPIWNYYKSGWNLNAVIVPHSTDTNKYYVFTTFPSKGDPPYGSYFVGQLTYSVVDMSMNGGLGAVVANQQNILLDKSTGHFMTVIPGNGCNYWVVVQNESKTSIDYSFRCYEVGEHGVSSTPVTSYFNVIPALNPNGNGKGVGTRAGNIIYSHTRQKIIASYESSDVTAYDFDPATGVVSNPTALLWPYPLEEHVSSSTIPAICLSPDESLLYVSGYASSLYPALYILSQYPLVMNGNQLSVGSPNTIYKPTKHTYLGGGNWQKSAMQLGADGKIYHCFTMGQNFIGRIEEPDRPGPACNFVPDAVKLLPGTRTTSSLPAPSFERKLIERGTATTSDTIVCFEQQVVLTAPQGYPAYRWQDGSPYTTYVADTKGTYYVVSTDEQCRQRTDTINLNIVNYDVELGKDIQTCFDAELKLATNPGDDAKYTWQDGSEEPTYTATDFGSYYVAVSKGGCIASDTINVSAAAIEIALLPDTTICTGTTITLGEEIEEATYAWQDGSTNAYYDAKGQGVYSVIVTKGKCVAEAETHIEEKYCDDCLSAMPNAFTPNRDGLNDVLKPVFYPLCAVSNYTFSIYNRFGEMVFSTNDPEEGWDGKYNKIMADVGGYFYYMRFTGTANEEYFHKGDVLLLR